MPVGIDKDHPLVGQVEAVGPAYGYERLLEAIWLDTINLEPLFVQAERDGSNDKNDINVSVASFVFITFLYSGYFVFFFLCKCFLLLTVGGEDPVEVLLEGLGAIEEEAEVWVGDVDLLYAGWNGE